MKREIKFRAWDGKRMLPPEDISQAPEYRTWLGKTDVGPLMQYTGLKDKNGVEICEGDVIKATITFMSFQLKGQVVFERGYFGICVPDNDETLPLYGLSDFEVLGNIYENPELVKEPR